MVRWRGVVLGAVMLALAVGPSTAHAAAGRDARNVPPKLVVTLAVSSTMVKAGSRQVITVGSVNGARCAVAVSYANGAADRQAALQTVRSVARSAASWSWRVDAHAPAGKGMIAAGCWLGKQTATTLTGFTLG